MVVVLLLLLVVVVVVVMVGWVEGCGIARVDVGWRCIYRSTHRMDLPVKNCRALSQDDVEAGSPAGGLYSTCWIQKRLSKHTIPRQALTARSEHLCRVEPRWSSYMRR